jgi:hypothetical protein
MGTLDYFISDKHIKDRVVNIPKDVYFGVWYFILLAKCYVFAQIIVVVLVWQIYIFYFNNFSFLLFGIASESKLEVLKESWFFHHICFCYFFFYV